jgi:hypothetical protein
MKGAESLGAPYLLRKATAFCLWQKSIGAPEVGAAPRRAPQGCCATSDAALFYTQRGKGPFEEPLLLFGEDNGVALFAFGVMKKVGAPS